MGGPTPVGETTTLEESLRTPGIDERPYREYVAGGVEVKPYLGSRGSVLTARLIRALSRFAEPRGIGEPFISLRCTFAGRSVVAAVAVLRYEKIEADEDETIIDETRVAPDLYIEFSSPEEPSDDRPRERLGFATAHGCPLGWLIDAERMTVHVYRPGHPAEPIPADGVLDGDPVLPGYRLAATELFDRLKLGRTRRQAAVRAGSPTDGGPGR